MRFLSLKTGLLLALVPLALAFAAGEEQEDKSYLPPSSLRGKPEEAPAALDKAPATVMREASIDPSMPELCTGGITRVIPHGATREQCSFSLFS